MHPFMPDLWRIFRIPLALAMLNGVGLIAALLGDELWDQLSWVALGSVVWISLRYRTKKTRQAFQIRAR